MERGDYVWTLARDHAHDFLRRFGDTWTRNNKDDLVQETAIAASRWAGGVRDPRRFWAAVRTIARRVRYRALSDASRERMARRDLASCRQGHGRGPEDDRSGERELYYAIAGRRVALRRVLPCIQRAVDRLGPLDRQLLLGFHEGFCCAELSVRSSRSEPCVKTRIHRARRRVQMEVEECVRAADRLDES